MSLGDAAAPSMLENIRASIRKLHQAGAHIVVGTDSPFTPVGLNTHNELVQEVRAGLTPFEALQTATTAAARLLGMSADLGTVESGKLADLAFIKGDPSVDIRMTRNVRMVMKNGQLYGVASSQARPLRPPRPGSSPANDRQQPAEPGHRRRHRCGPLDWLPETGAALVALVIVFDGFDNQVLGFALPAIIREWGVDRSAFAPVVALGLIGMAMGTALAGIVGDHFGRRPTLIGTMLLFACATAGISLARDLAAVSVLRFLAGAGIGEALPNAAALTAHSGAARQQHRGNREADDRLHADRRHHRRPACRAPVADARLALAVRDRRRRAVVTVALLLLAVLPESPRYLARHARRWPELARLLARCGHRTPPGIGFTDLTEQVAGRRAGLGALFAGFYRRDTLALWAASLHADGRVYGLQLDADDARRQRPRPGHVEQRPHGVQLGGVMGALCGAALISLYGSRWVMVGIMRRCVQRTGADADADPDRGIARAAGVIAGRAPAFFVNSVPDDPLCLGRPRLYADQRARHRHGGGTGCGTPGSHPQLVHRRDGACRRRRGLLPDAGRGDGQLLCRPAGGASAHGHRHDDRAAA